jgi:ABC-type antimicrobial peptide transport system permease subunit
MLRLTGLLLAAVTLVLLVAAANLGGLLVARGLTRRKELAVRLALGAPRRRVVSLFVAETLLLSLAGGAGGVLVASPLGWIVSRLYPGDVPLDLGLTPTTVACAAVLSLVTAVVVGAVPGSRRRARAGCRP